MAATVQCSVNPPIFDEDSRPDLDLFRLNPPIPFGKILSRATWQGVLLGLRTGDLPCFNRWVVLGPEEPTPISLVEVTGASGKVVEYPGYFIDSPEGKERVCPITHAERGIKGPCRLKVSWADGSAFSWQYDPGTGGIRRSLNIKVMRDAGLYCPAWLRPENYRELSNFEDRFYPEVGVAARHILRNCEI